MIELLMASVVVAAAAALLVGGLVAANRSADRRREQVLMAQLLASRLAMLDDQLTGDEPAQGAFPEPLEAFSWSLEQTDAPLAPLAQVTLTVSRNDHNAHVVTYRRLAE